jgi:hypothetical protein
VILISVLDCKPASDVVHLAPGLDHSDFGDLCDGVAILGAAVALERVRS